MEITPVERPRGSRARLDCLDEETILARIEHRLDPAAQARVDRHVAACAECRRLVSEAMQHVTPVEDTAHAATLDSDLDTERRSRGELLARGTTIDRYIVVDLLGRGGMGMVYRAFDPDLDRQVALKLVGLGALATVAREQARLRLVREAQALAKLSHPNVVAVHDVGRRGDDVFIAMELVDGCTLRTWLREAPRTPREILRVFQRAGDGLAAAHALGIVHRDFKPDNVMVGRDGRVRVVDFGLARLAEASRASRPSLPQLADAAVDSHELTRAGTMLGTPAYMSPEQDAGLEATAASDQFSFCVALYEALYGHGPFAGDSYPELARARRDGALIPPPAMRGVVSRVRRALVVGLRPAAAERHATIDALLDELAPRRSRRWIAAAAVALLAVGGTGAWFALHARGGADACATAGDEIARTWNASRHVALVGKLAHERPDRASAAVQVTAGLDRWAIDWAAARHAVCEATHGGAADPWSEPKAASQLQCLQRRSTQLDATLSVVDTLDQATDTALDTLGHLSAISECTQLATGVSEYDKAAGLAIIRQVIAARAAQNAAKLDEAVAIATSAVSAARGWASPALAAALQTLGDAQGANGRLDAARASYREAALAATAIAEPGMVADAWLATIALSMRDHKIDDKVETALFAAQLATNQLPADDSRRPTYHYLAGSLEVMRGRLAPGIAELELAVDGWQQIGKARHSGDIAGAANSLGLAYAGLGQWDKARANLELARDGFAAFGPDTPQLGTVLINLAQVEQVQGHFAAAEPLIEHGRAIYGKLRPGHPLIGEGELNLASLYVETGRCAEARPHLAKARAILEPAHGASSAVIGMVLLAEGQCEPAAQRAVELVERGRANIGEHPAIPTAKPEADYQLARALERAGGAPARVRALATTARAGFVAIGPGTALRVHAIDRMLAHGGTR